MAYRLTRAAEDQIDTLLLESAKNHGLEAAGRYAHLIVTVLVALGDEPGLVGSVKVPRFREIYAYPTRLARLRVESSRRVARPRHLVIYRLTTDRDVEILGLVHDRMVLSRAVRTLVRRADPRCG